MRLSNQQYAILKLFYENEKISLDDFPKYKLDELHSPFASLAHRGYLKICDHESYHNDTFWGITGTAYKITSTGKAVYEEHLDQQANESKSLDYQERQTIASEQSAEVANQANTIARESLKKARNANIISIISIGISIVTVALSILALVL